jgi:hypothetical protein
MSETNSPNRKHIRTATYKLGREFVPEVFYRICKIEVDLAKSQGWDKVLVSLEHREGVLTLRLSGESRIG